MAFPLFRLFSTGTIITLILTLTNSRESRESQASKAKWCGGGKTPVGLPCNASNPCPDELNLDCGQNDQCECSSQFLWSDNRCYCTYRAGSFGCETSRQCTEGSRCYHQCERPYYEGDPWPCQGTCDCCKGPNPGNRDGICPPTLCPGETASRLRSAHRNSNDSVPDDSDVQNGNAPNSGRLIATIGLMWTLYFTVNFLSTLVVGTLNPVVCLDYIFQDKQ